MQAAVRRFDNTQSVPRVVIPHISHVHRKLRAQGVQAAISTKAKKDHAAQRGRDACGTATRISASLFRRLSAFFGSTPDQGAKAAEFAVLTPGPGMFVNVQYVSRVVIAAPPKTPPVSPCKPLCARLRAGVACVPAFAHESEHGPFVPEVLKTVWTMCWKRWYDCISYAFRSFSEDEKESRIKGWRRNRRSARSLLPAVRAVDGGFNAGDCGAF